MGAVRPRPSCFREPGPASLHPGAGQLAPPGQPWLPTWLRANVSSWIQEQTTAEGAEAESSSQQDPRPHLDAGLSLGVGKGSASAVRTDIEPSGGSQPVHESKLSLVCSLTQGPRRSSLRAPLPASGPPHLCLSCGVHHQEAPGKIKYTPELTGAEYQEPPREKASCWPIVTGVDKRGTC